MKKRAKARRIYKSFLIVAITLMFSAMFAGTWNLLVSNNNEILQKDIMYKMSREASPMPGIIDDVNDWQYKRVTMAGSFDYRHEFLLVKTFEGSEGFDVLVPFKRISGKRILVNRGWVSEDKIGEIKRPKGLVKIEGIVMLPPKAEVDSDNNNDNNIWYSVDMEAMAKNAGIYKFSPYMIKLTDNKYGEFPKVGKVRLPVSNSFMKLAIVWYGFAAFVLMLLWLDRKKYIKIS